MPDKWCLKRKGSSNANSETMPLRKKGVTITRFEEQKGTDRWIAMMRQFTASHHEKCVAIKHDLSKPKERERKTTFLTGSTYEGEWNVLGMGGHGVYTFPHEIETIYEGQFDDGEFHGDGEIRFDNGAVMRGVWDHGKARNRSLFLDGILEYKPQDWKYLKTDRRFVREFKEGLQPAGQSFKTADDPPKEIPLGWYDVGFGLFDSKCVYMYDDLTRGIDFPDERVHWWMQKNCRTNPDLPVGATEFENWRMPTVGREYTPEPEITEKFSDSYQELDHRTTSRLSLDTKKKSSIKSCGHPQIYIPPSMVNPNSENRGSYSETALRADKPLTQTDQVVYNSMMCLLSEAATHKVPVISHDHRSSSNSADESSSKNQRILRHNPLEPSDL